MIFWISYSAYQRGVTADNQLRLLEYVIKESGRVQEDWLKSPDHITVWKREHDYVLDQYVTKAKKYVDLWIESPAGKLYAENIQWHKYTDTSL